MIDYLSIIEQHCGRNADCYQLLVKHSRQVADLALKIAAANPRLNIDTTFVEQAAMLHDIGVVRTDAPGIYCYGTEPYIKHGILGREMLDALGLPRHALVCERHTGAGISIIDIREQQMPLPMRDMLPVSIEEKLICYADKFYSKSHPDRVATYEHICKKMQRFGHESVARFEALHAIFNG